MRIRFKYTENGIQKYFEIRPRETGVTVALSAVGAYYGKYTYDGKEYITRWASQGDSYAWIAEFGAAIRAIPSRNQNPWIMTENNMMYDHSVPIADLYRTDGQLLHFDGSAGTAEFTSFIRTEYPGGTPESHYYLGALHTVNPSGSTSAHTFCTPCTTNGAYNTDVPPLVDYALITVTDNGVNYPCMLASVFGANETTTCLSYLFDLRVFDGTTPQPTTDNNTTTPYGRTGTYDFTSDQMVDVAPTGYSFVNRWVHGLTLYHINDLQAEAIFAEFWGNETLWQMFLNSTVKQIQGVLCMHKVPVPVASGSSTRALSIFGKRVARGELLEQLPLVNSQIVQYPETPQWVPIEEIYGDYFDYAGQTRFSVYLPFVGTVPIDVNKIMGGAIKTVYHIDLLTGNCIARVYGRNSMYNGAEVLLYQGSGNCALHIPYIGNDQGGMKLLGALAGVATAGLATVATGGAASAPALAAISGTAGYALAPHNASVNNIPTEASPLSYPYVCYIMEYPERLLTALQGTQTGFATASGGENTTVSNYSGFTQGFLHADIAGATEAEKAEIERAFENGVIL